MKNRVPTALLCLACLVTASSLYSQATQAQTAHWVGDTLWGVACTGAAQGYGPFDYTLRSQLPKELNIVEGAHFTSAVENLVSGNTSTGPMGDLDYTLRAWPNHHRALNSVIRLRIQYGDDFPRHRYTPAECYIQRGINFSPKDATTHMLYAMLLHRMDSKDRALSSYKTAESLDSNNVQIKYNMGLLLCDMARYEEAKVYADEVYAKKFPLPGLRRKLKENGYD